jgi:hypothetical protein
MTDEGRFVMQAPQAAAVIRHANAEGERGHAGAARRLQSFVFLELRC